jgi:hypothetical protein
LERDPITEALGQTVDGAGAPLFPSGNDNESEFTERSPQLFGSTPGTGVSGDRDPRAALSDRGRSPYWPQESSPLAYFQTGPLLATLGCSREVNHGM